MNNYILAIDQSTSGTKALLFDQSGTLLGRSDLPHRQIINNKGWVEHDPEEIYKNTVNSVKALVTRSGINKHEITAVGICNQRETTVAWHRETGVPVYNAIVWQCARAENICSGLEQAGHGEMIQMRTGLHLSPYFTAAKLAWILQHVPRAQKMADADLLCGGTIDSWLIYKLTKGRSFKTDYSNASRTQLFHLAEGRWDEEICRLFGFSSGLLAEICDSNALFGYTDFEGLLDTPVPIHGILGDSHGALFGQGCFSPGMVKCTYGTGSSIMMHIGEVPIESKSGIATSIAWAIDGKIDYVLEGNINYTGAVMKWICDDLGLISSPKEAGVLAAKASVEDETYLVPAFTGLGAPYWNSFARAALWNMGRHTGKAEIVRAAEECIAYQIADIIERISEISGMSISALRVDGGPAKDGFLMQFQSDILNIPVMPSVVEELSGTGAAFMAGIGIGLYDLKVLSGLEQIEYLPQMSEALREKKRAGWHTAVLAVLEHSTGTV